MNQKHIIWSVAFAGAVIAHSAALLGFSSSPSAASPALPVVEHEILLMPLGSLEGAIEEPTEPEQIEEPPAPPPPPAQPPPKPSLKPATKVPTTTAPILPPAEPIVASTLTAVPEPTVTQAISASTKTTAQPVKTGGNTTANKASKPPKFGVPNGVKKEQASYAGLLQAWFLKHKRYPHQARARHQEGVVKVWFKIDQQGNILEKRIEKSCGFSILDKATLSLLQKASPVPAPPQKLLATDLTFVVPIAFTIK